MDTDPIHLIREFTDGDGLPKLESEADLIRYFTRAAKSTLDESVVVPPSDDAAVLSPTAGKNLVSTVDMLVESVDFDFSYASAEDVGYKSVMVNLSDIAAMRAKPRWVTIGLGLREIVPSMIEGLTAGFLTACKEAEVCLAGGDISCAPCMVLSVQINGEVDPGSEVTRSGAKDGMVVAVSGEVGGSYAGYRLLSSKENHPVKKKTLHTLRRKHLRPKARFDLTDFLKQVDIGAMIDISDGFMIDLKRILEASGVAGEIETDRIPILAETTETAELFGENPLKWALRGGEDFELILCLREKELEKLNSILPDPSLAPVPVGRVVDGKPGELLLLDERGKRVDFEQEGFDHFKSWEVV